MNVFTYGSLMFDQVWRAVTGRMHPSSTGRLEHFAAWKIAGQTFPGMAPSKDHEVNGRIWREVTSQELERLDSFESGIYDREEVLVKTDDSDGIKCWAYVVRPDSRSLLLAELWDSEEFRKLHLATFVLDEGE